MKFLSSINVVRVVLAFTVALWMAGAGCMLGCSNMAMAAAHAPAATLSNVVVAGDACASAHSHDCCASHGTKSPTRSKKAIAPSGAALATEMAGAASMMENCPLAVNASAALSKARSDQSHNPLDAARSEELGLNFEKQENTFAAPSLLPNRGHTYLRCCVFLI